MTLSPLETRTELDSTTSSGMQAARQGSAFKAAVSAGSFIPVQSISLEDADGSEVDPHRSDT